MTTIIIGFLAFHIFHLFFGLMCPFRAKQLTDSSVLRRKVHLIEVVVVLFIGFLLPTITISISEYQDSGWNCIPQSPQVAFYVTVLPSDLMFVTGLALLFGSFWVLRRVSCTASFAVIIGHYEVYC